jgi:hypothetical protein
MVSRMHSAVRILIVVVIVSVVGGSWLVLRQQAIAEESKVAAVASAEQAGGMLVPEGGRHDEAPTELRVATPEPLPASEPSPEKAATVWDPDDPVGIVLYGAVYDPQGQLLVSGRQSVSWDSGDGSRSSAVLTSGTYSIAGLRPGRGTLTCGKQGVLPYESELDLTADEPLRRVDIHLESAVSLCVRVLTPSGRELWDELTIDTYDRPQYGVVATPEPLGRSLPPTGGRLISRNAHGTWISRHEQWGDRTVDAGCEGMLDLKSPLPLWVNLLHRSEVVATQFVEPEATEVVFVVTPEQALATYGSVRVQIVDGSSGEPVTDARVDLSNFQSGGGGQPTDEQGVAEQDLLAPGLLDLEVHAKGYETVRDTILLGPGEHKDLGRLPLDPATSISGRVVDSQGVPFATTLAYAPADWDHDPAGHIPRVFARSSAEGDFTIPGIGRRRYTVWVRDRNAGIGSTLHVVDTTAGDVEGVTIVVALLTEVVMRTPWPADVSHEVTMLDSRGLALWRTFLDGDTTLKRSYAPGEYVLLVAGAAQEKHVTLGSTPSDVTLPAP